MLNKKKNSIRIKVASILQMYRLIMNKNVPLHPNSSDYQMCISKRQKSYIYIMRQPKQVS